mgnify:CR=1 FL=1
MNNTSKNVATQEGKPTKYPKYFVYVADGEVRITELANIVIAPKSADQFIKITTTEDWEKVVSTGEVVLMSPTMFDREFGEGLFHQKGDNWESPDDGPDGGDDPLDDLCVAIIQATEPSSPTEWSLTVEIGSLVIVDVDTWLSSLYSNEPRALKRFYNIVIAPLVS